MRAPGSSIQQVFRHDPRVKVQGDGGGGGVSFRSPP